jgi:hypothetical protein
MNTSTRIFVITHLCLVFSYLSWVALYPIGSEYYENKTLEHLYHAAGTSDPQLKEGLDQLNARQGRSTTDKLTIGLRAITTGIPPYSQGWAFFSLAICFLLLFRINGAKSVVWLLPFLVALYAVDNWRNAPDPAPAPDAHLFPTEEYLKEHYISGPTPDAISEQYEQLKGAWSSYLEAEWEGERNFHIARIRARETAPASDPFAPLRDRESPLWLAVYLGWNLLFAGWISINRHATGLVA